VNGSGGDTPPPPPPPPPAPPPPPHVPDLERFWAALMAAIPRQVECTETVGCSSVTFFKHNSPVFDGSDGPMAADD
jgi:hypothetical protein